jgi:hypothetical protein
MKPVAQLLIKQHLLRGAQCPRGFKKEVKDTNSINFNLNDLTDPITRDKILDDPRYIKNIRNFVEIIDDPRCITFEWTPWSECSTTCGYGIERRSRQYKDVKIAAGFCNELLEDTQMCLGMAGTCDSDDNQAFNIADM